jgi:hypothetical protein
MVPCKDGEEGANVVFAPSSSVLRALQRGDQHVPHVLIANVPPLPCGEGAADVAALPSLAREQADLRGERDAGIELGGELLGERTSGSYHVSHITYSFIRFQ